MRLPGHAIAALMASAAPMASALSCGGDRALTARTDGPEAGPREAASPDSAGPAASCPQVGAITASPAATRVGNEVDVGVFVGTTGGAPLTFTWTATDG